MEKNGRLTGLTDTAFKVVRALRAFAEVADEVLAAAVQGLTEKHNEPEPPSKSHESGSDAGATEDAQAPVGSDETATQSTEYAWVCFEALAETTFGQTVCVVGADPSLGAWDPERALALDPAEYPKWSARARVEAKRPLEYKYLRKNVDGSFAWEARDGNRVIESPTSEAGSVGTDEVRWEVEQAVASTV
ncbi:MAG: hypothetical protein JW940_14335 [Polyangiaceae bacterium]|nr:hypothetical protein [Polyangiaceae bacterium]